MRLMKKIISLFVILVMMLNISVVAFAADANGANHVSNEIATIEIQGEDVYDSYTFFDTASNEYISILRIIHPDGTTDYSVDSKTYHSSGTSQGKEDYEHYYNLATNLENGKGPSSRATGKEVSGTHYYYTTIYKTLDHNQLEEAIFEISTSGVAGGISWLLGLGYFGSGVVGCIVTAIVALSPTTRYDRLDIIQANYEVRSQWDGSYICHCAHITTTVYLYDANGNLGSKPPEYDYVQAIGGI